MGTEQVVESRRYVRPTLADFLVAGIGLAAQTWSVVLFKLDDMSVVAYVGYFLVALVPTALVLVACARQAGAAVALSFSTAALMSVVLLGAGILVPLALGGCLIAFKRRSLRANPAASVLAVLVACLALAGYGVVLDEFYYERGNY